MQNDIFPEGFYKEELDLPSFLPYFLERSPKRESLYFYRCRCREQALLEQALLETPPKLGGISEGRPILYPYTQMGGEGYEESFQIKYEQPLTVKGKFILNSFKGKYVYYAIEDLIDNLKSNPKEQKNLLTILYSSMLSLHNNLYINFFDMWIKDIYITEIQKPNRFLKSEDEQPKCLTNITLILLYKTRLPFKKPEPLW